MTEVTFTTSSLKFRLPGPITSVYWTYQLRGLIMKFSKLHETAEGKFRIMKGTKQAFTAEFDTKEEAMQHAAALTAKFHIQQAKAALQKIENWDVAQPVGWDVVELLESVLQPMHEESDNFDASDPSGWRC